MPTPRPLRAPPGVLVSLLVLLAIGGFALGRARPTAGGPHGEPSAAGRRPPLAGVAVPVASPASPRCPVVRGAGLGRVAYVRRGALHVLHLARCRDVVLVARGVRPPVRWSPDGRWIAFGSVAVVPSSGGRVRHPFGTPRPWRWARWEWSPTEDRLAIATRGRGVLTWAPGEGVRRVLPRGFGLHGLAFDPTGTRLAVQGPVQRLVVVDVASGARRLVHRVPRAKLAPPLVAGWSPDGRWILFWSLTEDSASLAADGLPLRAVPVWAGRPVPVVRPVLVHEDFLSWCDGVLVVTAGGDRYVNLGKRLVRAGPPRWRPRLLLDDPRRSFIWPSCSPDGRWVVSTSAPDRSIGRFGVDRRSLWLVRAEGGDPVRLTRAHHVADELPRWSADGRFVLFVRRDLSCRGPGRLFLLPIDPVAGRQGRLLGPLALLGPGCGYYGHQDWALSTDWFRPDPDRPLGPPPLAGPTEASPLAPVG